MLGILRKIRNALKIGHPSHRNCPHYSMFDSSPCAWYLKGRDYCHHPWKRKGVFTDAKTHPTMVPHRSTWTDGDARLCAAREKRAASTVSSKSRNLSTETDLPTVSTDALSRCGHQIDTRVDNRKEVKTCSKTCFQTAFL